MVKLFRSQRIIRSENKILNLEDFPEYFQDIKDLDDEIKDWLDYKDKG
ncbi:MAG: hypothetical protein M3P22_01345 [bacterium]|nr:hypothetical protein [bacterium]